MTIPSHVYRHAVIVGATGGIGASLLDCCIETGLAETVSAWARTPPRTDPRAVDWQAVDLRSEASIARAADTLREVDLVIVATGLLHRAADAADARAVLPEKTWRSLDASVMAETFAINTIGPALVAKHVLPRFPRGRRAVFAALSARVGSIGDNRLGGWYSYRASKAALNQIIRTLSIELRVRRPEAICVGLHPGTVDTRLSQPYQANVVSQKLFTPDIAAAQLLDVLASLSVAESGGTFDWSGKRIPE